MNKDPDNYLVLLREAFRNYKKATIRCQECGERLAGEIDWAQGTYWADLEPDETCPECGVWKCIPEIWSDSWNTRGYLDARGAWVWQSNTDGTDALLKAQKKLRELQPEAELTPLQALEAEIRALSP